MLDILHPLEYMCMYIYLSNSDPIDIHILEGIEKVSVGHHALGCLPADLLVASHDHHTLTHCLNLLRWLCKGSAGALQWKKAQFDN